MKSLNGKLVLSALTIAILTTPTFAKSARHRHAHVYIPQYGYSYSGQYGNVYTPPPPNTSYAPAYRGSYMGR
jgi:hypothetical protein